MDEIAVGEVEEQVFPPDLRLNPTNVANDFDNVQLLMCLEQFINCINRLLIFVPMDHAVDGQFEVASRYVFFDLEHFCIRDCCLDQIGQAAGPVIDRGQIDQRPGRFDRGNCFCRAVGAS